MPRDKGHCEGRKPYGAMAGEQETIAQMRKLRQQGLAYDAIAKALNEDGITPRTTLRAGRQTRWHGAAVQRILAREESKPR